MQTQGTGPTPYSWLLNRGNKNKPTPEVFSPLLRVSEASRLLNCCETTVRRAIAAGLISSVRIGVKGYHRVPLAEIHRIGSLKGKQNE
jgi:excisionase family DNA binding protein